MCCPIFFKDNLQAEQILQLKKKRMMDEEFSSVLFFLCTADITSAFLNIRNIFLHSSTYFILEKSGQCNHWMSIPLLLCLSMDPLSYWLHGGDISHLTIRCPFILSCPSDREYFKGQKVELKKEKLMMMIFFLH